MNELRSPINQILALALTLILSAGAGTGCAPAKEKVTGAADSLVIQPDIGASDFAPGDRVVITSLRGNREHLEIGGRYTLDGSYTLASAGRADLAWFVTSHGPVDSTEVEDTEHISATKGSGTFHLEKTLHNDGWMHVSFYVDGRSIGGVYFGEKGFEDSVLRKIFWSELPNPAAGNSKHIGSAVSAGAGASQTSPANLAILAYLGDPVPAPAKLDDRYSPSNLKLAFNDLSRKLGITALRLEVDESEFPFVVYGLIAGRCDYHALADGARQLDGYTYAGSVTSGDERGTYFAVDMIPPRELPRARIEDCNRRLMIRLQMLAASVRAHKPDSAPRPIEAESGGASTQ